MEPLIVLLVLLLAGGMLLFGLWINADMRWNQAQDQLLKNRHEYEERLLSADAVLANAQLQVHVARMAEQAAKDQIQAAREHAQAACAAAATAGRHLGDIDDALRNAEIAFGRVSDVIRAMVLIVPPTGRVSVQWNLLWTRPYSPRVRTCFCREAGEEQKAIQGQWVRRLDGGRVYRLELEVFDGSQLVDSLSIHISVPTPSQYLTTVRGLEAAQMSAAPPPVSPDKQIESYMTDAIARGRAVQEAQRQIRESGLDPKTQDLLLARLEAWAVGQEDDQPA